MPAAQVLTESDAAPADISRPRLGGFNFSRANRSRVEGCPGSLPGDGFDNSLARGRYERRQHPGLQP